MARKTVWLPSRWQAPRRHGPLAAWSLSPPQMFVLSFVFVCAVGTIGLKFLPGLYRGSGLSWIDAAFTAVSATCVTGLVVVNTADYFTHWGQLYLLVLIQLGGLGMITFTSWIILIVRGRLSLRSEIVSAGASEISPYITPRELLRDVIRFTVLFEAVGFVLLYISWLPLYGWSDAAWHALFHSVSAFCNAGFSTFPDSYISLRQHPLSLLVTIALIVSGGLGFLTLKECWLKWQKRHERAPFRISLHSRLVLATTLLLLLAGWLGFLFAEWNFTLSDLGLFDRLINALFMSATPRTAGFNNIDYTQATETTCFATMLLMMVGGSPSSTAGGIKTTSFAVIGIVAWSRWRGNRAAMALNRSIPDETINRTIGLVVVVFAVLALGILALTVSEFHPAGHRAFLQHAFEAVSALNTVGLSMNATAGLSQGGRVLIILLMLLGRVGPLTFASALTLRYVYAGRFRYAYEDVIVG